MDKAWSYYITKSTFTNAKETREISQVSFIL